MIRALLCLHPLIVPHPGDHDESSADQPDPCVVLCPVDARVRQGQSRWTLKFVT